MTWHEFQLLAAGTELGICLSMLVAATHTWWDLRPRKDKE